MPHGDTEATVTSIKVRVDEPDRSEFPATA